MTRDTTKATIRKLFLLALLAVLVAAGLLGAAAAYLGIRTRMDLTAYAGMIHDRFSPLWRDLALRRIGKGDRLAGTPQQQCFVQGKP